MSAAGGMRLQRFCAPGNIGQFAGSRSLDACSERHFDVSDRLDHLRQFGGLKRGSMIRPGQRPSEREMFFDHFRS